VPSALEHKMTGLLWSRVLAGEVDCPQPWKEQLATSDLVVRARHRRLWKALDDLGSILAGLDVEWAVVKGVPTEARWYARAGERPCSDLDILLSPRDTSRATEVVAALGPPSLSPSTLPDMLERGVAQSVDVRFGSETVDLHVDLLRLGPPVRYPDRLWARTLPFQGQGGGPAVRVPDAELALVHFLVHLNRDTFCWLLGFADVARILEREELDWRAIENLVEGEGLEAPVFGGLAAVSETLGLDAPHPRVPGWRSTLWRIVWRPSVRLGGDLGWARHRHRAHWLPVVTAVRPRTLLGWARGQLVLTPAVAADNSPDRRGPWWWVLVRGRIDRVVRRRRLAARLDRR
jgi:hypothetical protein